MSRALLLLAIVLATSSCKSAHEQTRVTAIIGGSLIAAVGAAPLADAVVVVDSGRIRAAGPRATTPISAGSEKVDATGFTIEPAPGASPIAPGSPADLVLRRGTNVERVMRNGEWVEK